MRTMRWLLLIVLLAAPGTSWAQLGLLTFEPSELEIETANGRHHFDIELALTPDQQTQGLMYRQQMDADHGMLFVHQGDDMRAMWMRNTYLPLDMLFIDSAGRVAHIVERTVPQSLQTISSREPVMAVLEVNAGTASRLGIAVGDRVIHPVFKSAP